MFHAVALVVNKTSGLDTRGLVNIGLSRKTSKCRRRYCGTAYKRKIKSYRKRTHLFRLKLLPFVHFFIAYVTNPPSPSLLMCSEHEAETCRMNVTTVLCRKTDLRLISGTCFRNISVFGRTPTGPRNLRPEPHVPHTHNLQVT